MDIEKLIRNVADFPIKGVLYKDITPLLLNPKASHEVVSQFIDALQGQTIDKVVGVESRGFLFGILLAQKLNAGFVPLRKAGKLPFTTLGHSYTLEYGKSTLEIHTDAISKGDRVLIHDDVLATGGTAEAACKLVNKLQGNIVQCQFLIEIAALQGRTKLKNVVSKSLITY